MGTTSRPAISYADKRVVPTSTPATPARLTAGDSPTPTLLRAKGTVGVIVRESGAIRVHQREAQRGGAGARTGGCGRV